MQNLGTLIVLLNSMDHLFEVSTINQCIVFFKEKQGDQEHLVFSAYVHPPGRTPFIIDDCLLWRLKRKIGQVLDLYTSN